jgi:hypothetical protein
MVLYSLLKKIPALMIGPLILLVKTDLLSLIAK